MHSFSICFTLTNQIFENIVFCFAVLMFSTVVYSYLEYCGHLEASYIFCVKLSNGFAIYFHSEILTPGNNFAGHLNWIIRILFRTYFK